MALLFSIVEQLQDNARANNIGDDLNFIEAEFRTKRGRLVASIPVAAAMGHLVEDVYVFVEFDLRESANVKLVRM